MFNDIYNIILELFFGSASLTPIQELLTNCLSYFACACVVIVPIWVVIGIFRFIGYSMRLDK